MESFIIKIIKYVLSLYYETINYILLKINGVKYATFPIINGIPYIRNRGIFIIGRFCKINSGYINNPIGFDKSIFYIKPNAKLCIGDGVGMSSVAIYCSNSITIKDDVFIGGGVRIYDTDFHSLDYETRVFDIYDCGKSGTVTIKSGAFIGAGSFILKNVVIGEKSVVGAGSVVTKNIPDNEIWAGNPAKFIRKSD